MQNKHSIRDSQFTIDCCAHDGVVIQIVVYTFCTQTICTCSCGPTCVLVFRKLAIDLLWHCVQVSLSPFGYSVKSVIDPTTCVNMHNHYCWGFVDGSTMTLHFVDPDVAVLQHYKRCHFAASECRQMMNVTRTDDTILKYRDQLANIVSRKFAEIGRGHASESAEATAWQIEVFWSTEMSVKLQTIPRPKIEAKYATGLPLSNVSAVAQLARFFIEQRLHKQGISKWKQYPFIWHNRTAMPLQFQRKAAIMAMRIIDTSPTWHFAYWTVRLQFGHFAYKAKIYTILTT